MYDVSLLTIRENITPRGDGNLQILFHPNKRKPIRENITPRGDGNLNSPVLEAAENGTIRENITPRGDGN